MKKTLHQTTFICLPAVRVNTDIFYLFVEYCRICRPTVALIAGAFRVMFLLFAQLKNYLAGSKTP